MLYYKCHQAQLRREGHAALSSALDWECETLDTGPQHQVSCRRFPTSGRY